MGPNEKVLRDAYDRFSQGDMEHLYTILSDDVVWSTPGDRRLLRFPGEWRAKTGVREYFKLSRTDWDVTEHRPVEVLCHEDRRFAVRVSVRAVNKRTHAPIAIEKIDLVTMKDGKCTSYSETFDTAPLEHAAGLVRNALAD